MRVARVGGGRVRKGAAPGWWSDGARDGRAPLEAPQWHVALQARLLQARLLLGNEKKDTNINCSFEENERNTVRNRFSLEKENERDMNKKGRQKNKNIFRK